MDTTLRMRVTTAIVAAVLAFAIVGLRDISSRAGKGDAQLKEPSQQDSQQQTDSTQQRNVRSILDLQRLSPSTRRSLNLIFLIPVGVLITAVGQRIGGLRTLSTFSPTLLALSQLRSNWRIAVVVLVTMFGVGQLFRTLFIRLELPAVSRRGVVAVFVVVFLALVLSLFEHFGLTEDAQAVFLPVVVTTVMIERFFTIQNKEGMKIAMIVLANSLFIAVVCFIIFAFVPMGPRLLALPELELLIVSGLVLVGSYNGPRLVDLVGISGGVSLEQVD